MKRTPLQRKTPLRAKAPMRRRRASDPIPKHVTDEVLVRSGGYCEARTVANCSVIGTHRHHRKLRRFGDHSAASILLCCERCHAAIHAFPERSYERGLLVMSHEDPSTVGVLTGY